jgi:hypothetical protein
LIHTSRGVAPIEEVKKNDLVLSYNHKKKVNEYRKVTNTVIHEKTKEKLYLIKLKDGTEIKVTENHKFFTGIRYRKIKDILLDLPYGKMEKIFNYESYKASSFGRLKTFNWKGSKKEASIIDVNDIISYQEIDTEFVYDISVEKNNNFYLATEFMPILVHNSGKSEHLDQVLIELCIDHSLKGIYFSPENWPTSMHLIKLVEKIVGNNFWESKIDLINSTKGWIEDHIYWAYPDDGFNLDNVLDHIRRAVLRYGVNWYVIDPWNKLDHQYQGQETKYISECLDKIDVFNKKNNVHGFIVAHPTKMDKDKDGNFVVPNLYSISGSAHFFNKTSLGWTVYKKGPGQTEVHIQKVKFKYWGDVGLIEYLWDAKTGRYFTIDPDYSNWLKPTDNNQTSVKLFDDNKVPF